MHNQQHLAFAAACRDITAQGTFSVINLGPFDKYIEGKSSHQSYEDPDSECDEAPESAPEEGLVQQLDTNLLTSGLLISPFCALARIPAVSASPVLRMISWLGYVLVATSFVTSSIFRLRMKFLGSSERTVIFAQEFSRAQGSSWSMKSVAASSPVITIYGSITLFLVLLSGWTLGSADTRGTPSPDTTDSVGRYETMIIILAIVCGISHCGLVLRTAIKLG